jgi:hypothetical protein
MLRVQDGQERVGAQVREGREKTLCGSKGRFSLTFLVSH